MANCADCKKDAPLDELVADHIMPLSRGGKNTDENIQWVHRSCHRRSAKWYWRAWWAVREWFNNLITRYELWLQSWEMCRKESQGYRCQHRIMSNGRKECGDD
jgi:hypothetical protein